MNLRSGILQGNFPIPDSESASSSEACPYWVQFPCSQDAWSAEPASTMPEATALCASKAVADDFFSCKEKIYSVGQLFGDEQAVCDRAY